MTARRLRGAKTKTWRDHYDALSTPTREVETLTRRRVVQGLLGVGGMAVMGLPDWLTDAAAAPLAPTEKILVVVMMGGGNDTMNTFVPAGHGRYRDYRGHLSVRVDGSTFIEPQNYLHPNLHRLKSRFDSGQVAIVAGVGEPNKDHSHFSSMARWMAGHAIDGPPQSGWLGRYLDGLGSDVLGGVSVGDTGIPLHLKRRVGETVGLPTHGDLFGAELLGDNGQPSYNVPVYEALTRLGADNLRMGPWAQQLAGTQASAIGIAQDVVEAYSPEIQANSRFVRDMEIAARVINLDLGARILTVNIGGFDTHGQQRPKHDNLLNELDIGINRLLTSIRPQLRDRVACMTFSEFGRRARKNGSSGTDHGSAGSLFIVGPPVNGGVYGAQPSLNHLDERGDLKASVDFRSVYATVLEDYLGADSTEVLGGNYERLGIFDVPPRCAGERATIIGTEGDDIIYGTPQRDVIVGLGGQDTIYGRAGDDVICGGDGSDRIDAGDGDDIVSGGANSDRILGGRDNDRLWGDGGNDRISGQNQRDVLNGGAGADRLVGGRGVDQLISDAADIIVQQ